MTKQRYFLTVDWCAEGRRGLFCDRDGKPFSTDRPHRQQEMWDILGTFARILDPKSMPLTEEEVAKYTVWCPLAEYKNQYGIVRRAST